MDFKGLFSFLCLFVMVGVGLGQSYDFDLLENVTLEYADGSPPFKNMSVDESCSCRSFCFVNPNCSAFALHMPEPDKTTWQCHIFLNENKVNPEDPKEYKMIPSPNTLFGARAVDPEISLKKDGFYYFLSNKYTSEETVLRHGVAEECISNRLNLPSVRLAQIKSKISLEVAQEYSKYNREKLPVLIDMYRRYIGSMWMNGVSYTSSEFKTKTDLEDFVTECEEEGDELGWESYTLKENKCFVFFTQTPATVYGLCQANYLGLVDADPM